MNTIFPSSFALAIILMVIQTYLLICLTLPVLRRMKILKRPYGGMDYAESLPAAVIMLGVLLISTANTSAVFQGAMFYNDSNNQVSESFFLFFARSFVLMLFFSALFLILNFLNIRYMFRGHFVEPMMSVSLILCALTIGLAIICWISCSAVMDNLAPKIINFR